jgi:Na+-translocating ferredoxin:NAD+ oxidoreductase RNF subunit RnfB
MRERDCLAARLPGINCGACGAPSCTTFAEDVVTGLAEESRCIVRHNEELEDRLARLLSGTRVGLDTSGLEERHDHH